VNMLAFLKAYDHVDAYSAEIAFIEPYARASTRLASRTISWIAGAFDFAFSAASTLHPKTVSGMSRTQAGVRTNGNSDATSGLTTSSERFVRLVDRCMGEDAAGVVLSKLVTRFVVAIRSCSIVVSCVCHIPVA
jgi:hypothetical protein